MLQCNGWGCSATVLTHHLHKQLVPARKEGTGCQVLRQQIGISVIAHAAQCRGCTKFRGYTQTGTQCRGLRELSESICEVWDGWCHACQRNRRHEVGSLMTAAVSTDQVLTPDQFLTPDWVLRHVSWLNDRF